MKHLLIFCILYFITCIYSISSPEELLKKFQFKNYGVTTKNDVFVNKVIPCLYLEPENSWASGGAPCNYLFQKLSNGTLIVPPNGIRSAIPNGGMGAGNIELRGDGSLHHWTIDNRHPAASMKIDKSEDAFFGVKINKKASTIRTHPPQNLTGVHSLSYSGSYPVSKINILDDNISQGLNISLFSYHEYSINNLNVSSRPNNLYNLLVENPTKQSVEVSFMFNLPMQVQDNMFLHLRDNPAIFSHKTKTFEKCVELCRKKECDYWMFDKKEKICSMKPINQTDDRRVGYGEIREGFISGVIGHWKLTASDKSMTNNCYNLIRPGNRDSQGDLALCGPAKNGFDVKFGTGNNATDIWKQFENDKFTDNDKILNNHNLYGAISVSSTIQAGETLMLPISFGWYFPNRDFSGIIIGNYYQYIWDNAVDVATTGLNRITETLSNILLLHETFFYSSLPDWFSDSLINTLSQIRTAWWRANGKWRQWEAVDCANKDSIHNDGERHIPYLMFWPETTWSKIQGWAGIQLKNGTNAGMIMEQFGCGTSANFESDPGCGRVMSDNTQMWLMYVWELQHWYNKKDYIKQYWNTTIIDAINWQIKVSTNKYWQPYKLISSYDIFEIERFDIATYNTVWHFFNYGNM